MKKFLPFLLLLPLCLVNNTYADEVQDVTYTITSESASPINLCGWDTGPNCEDYSYILVNSDIFYQNAFGKNLTFDIGYQSGSSDLQMPLFTNLIRFSINSDMTRIRVYKPGTSTLPVGNTITVTLTNGDSCPSCPEPVIPDCEDPPIVRMFEGSFWNIASAIVGLIVPILALFLLFRLVHGLMFGRGL